MNSQEEFELKIVKDYMKHNNLLRFEEHRRIRIHNAGSYITVEEQDEVTGAFETSTIQLFSIMAWVYSKV